MYNNMLPTHICVLPQPRDSFGGIPGVPARPSEEGQPHLEPPGPPKRRWQSWKGNNKFFLDGERKAVRTAIELLPLNRSGCKFYEPFGVYDSR